MKLITENILILIGVVLFIIFVVCFITIFYFSPLISNNHLCASHFDNVEFSYWTGWKTNLRNFDYESVDKEHYNCCWDETILTDNGYITERKCKGFVRYG